MRGLRRFGLCLLAGLTVACPLGTALSQAETQDPARLFGEAPDSARQSSAHVGTYRSAADADGNSVTLTLYRGGRFEFSPYRGGLVEGTYRWDVTGLMLILVPDNTQSFADDPAAGTRATVTTWRFLVRNDALEASSLSLPVPGRLLRKIHE